jgi:hypothetical protein
MPCWEQHRVKARELVQELAQELVHDALQKQSEAMSKTARGVTSEQLFGLGDKIVTFCQRLTWILCQLLGKAN